MNHRGCAHVNADGFDLMAQSDDSKVCFACGYREEYRRDAPRA